MTDELEMMAQVKDREQIKSKRKALIALFPYAVRWEGGRGHRMFDAYFDIFMIPEARELVAEPIVRLLDEASPDSPNWVMTLMLPYADWGSLCHPNIVAGWARAALAVPYTDNVGQNMVDTLLQIASDHSLLPFIPVNVWALLKKRRSLPPIYRGRQEGSRGHVVRRVRELGDVDILESYFLLVWSEWDYVWSDGFREMCTSIREDFGGIGMWRHREVLIQRLDHVLGELDKGLDHLKQQKPSLDKYHIPRAGERYGPLREELLEVDRRALEILTRTPSRSFNSFNYSPHRISTESHSTSICALPLPCL